MNKPSCDIINKKAVRACYCINGYARDRNNVCVKINSDECQNQCLANSRPEPAKPSKGTYYAIFILNVSIWFAYVSYKRKKKFFKNRRWNSATFLRDTSWQIFEWNFFYAFNCGVFYQFYLESCALKKNEIFIDGGSPCQTTCATLNKVCNIKTKAPVKACYCINGYARNKNGVCVKINSKQCQAQCARSASPPTPSKGTKRYFC